MGMPNAVFKFKKGDRVETTKRSACEYVPSGQFGTIVGIDDSDPEFPYKVEMDKRGSYRDTGYWFSEYGLKLVKEEPQDEDTITIKAPKALEDKIKTMISEHNNEEHRKNVNRKALERLNKILANNIDPNDQVLNEIATKSISLIQDKMQEYGEI